MPYSVTFVCLFCVSRSPIMENTKTNTYYKYCIVPVCPSTTFKTPNKLFIRVPEDKNRRIKWFKACRRNIKDISKKNTAIHVCEDHFNLPEDMENYIKFKLMGGFKKMKPNVVPHIFDCQPDRKRSVTHAARAVAVKRAKRRILDVAMASMIEDQALNESDLQIDVTSSQYLEISTQSLNEMDSEASGLVSFLPDACPKRDVSIQAHPTVRSKSVQCKLHCGVTVGLSPIKVYRGVVQTVSKLTSFSESTPSKNSSDENYSESGSVSDYSLKSSEIKEVDKEKKEQFKNMSLKDKVDNSSFLVDVKEEHEEQITSAFIRNKIASCTVIKAELNGKYEIEQNKAEPQSWPQFILLSEGLKAIKTEKILDVSNNYDLEGSKDLDTQQLEIFLKTKNRETKKEIENRPEVVYDDWKIKNEELDLKEEDLLENEINVSSGLCTEEKCDEYKKHNWHVTDFQTEWKDSVEEHLLRPENPPIADLFRCNKCEYQTHKKLNLTRHLKNHKNPAEVELFKCDKCEHRTRHKNNLKTHSLRHKDHEEVDLFKCDKCEYQTPIKRYLTLHVVKHRNPEAVDLFRCDKCEYQTHYKNNLRRHTSRHKNPREVNFLRCDQCIYQTRHKNNFKTHSLRHKNPGGVNLFKCAKCDYQTCYKHNIKTHCLRHKNPEEVDLFKCDKCKYQTPYKHNFKEHSLRHISPEEANLFRCDICEYQTRFKRNLKAHSLRHKNPEEVVSFKCDKCEYETRYKRSLKKHSLRHKNPERVDLFQCDKCEYQTCYKHNIKTHSLRHKNPKEVDLFKCDKCKYQTIYKHHFMDHSLRHKNPEEVDLFRCDKCEYQTRYKRNFKQHSLRH